MILASASPTGLGLGFAAIGAYALSAAGARWLGERAARGLFGLALALHGAGLAWGVASEQPHFGFAPALSVTAWLVALVYAGESLLLPLPQMRWPLSAMGMAAVGLALLFAGAPLHASASSWLPVHWALGIASYGLFGAAVAHGWFLNHTEDRIRKGLPSHGGVPLLTLERLTFRLVGAGFLVLTAALALGFLFRSQVFGTQATFRWDHKTAFSALSWLTFAWLLLGRVRFGWRGKRAVRLLYLGAGLLLLAYAGSRFVLEIILQRPA